MDKEKRFENNDSGNVVMNVENYMEEKESGAVRTPDFERSHKELEEAHKMADVFLGKIQRIEDRRKKRKKANGILHGVREFIKTEI